MSKDLILNEKEIIDTQTHLSWLQKIVLVWRQLTRTQKILFIVILLLATIGSTFAFNFLSLNPNINGGNLSLNNKNPQAIEIETPEQPRDHLSPLTGVMITKTEYEATTKHRVLGVLIENHTDARPQSGLDQADLVFETLVEGGITRFLAVYYSQAPEVAGPVRSLRKYYVDLMAGFDDPLMMHIGGAVSDNPQANALGEIQKYGMKSLGVSGGKFWRVTNRQAPHNAYTNTNELWQQAETLGWVGPSGLGVWQFQDVKQPITDASINTIKINWDGWGETPWSVRWEFDAEQNLYQRFHPDGVHIDAVTEKQLSTRNLIVVYAPQYLANDGSARIVYELVGQGEAKIFRDGQVISATWRKLTRQDRFNFEDTTGAETSFNRGSSWITIVPIGSEIIF